MFQERFMSKVTVLFGALTISLISLGGCASTGSTTASRSYDAAGYVTAEKDGRLYVFIPNSPDHMRFKRTGDMGKSVTRIGAGPNNMTVVAEQGVNLDKYLAAAK
jgi:hypothetical protein